METGPHTVFDPGSLDSCVEVIAHLTFITLVELSSEKGRDVVRLYGVDGGTGEMSIYSLEVLLMLERDICCILNLHNAPVIAQSKSFDDGTEPLCKKIEPCVKDVHFEGIAEALSPAEYRYLTRGIVHETIWMPDFAR
jgi:hypothetical protein